MFICKLWIIMKSIMTYTMYKFLKLTRRVYYEQQNVWTIKIWWNSQKSAYHNEPLRLRRTVCKITFNCIYQRIRNDSHPFQKGESFHGSYKLTLIFLWHLIFMLWPQLVGVLATPAMFMKPTNRNFICINLLL